MTEKKNVHQRLAEVMRHVTYIRKEAKAGMKYTVISHDKVTAKARPALLEAGIVYYPVRCEHSHDGNRAECSMTVRFVNIDEPTDFFDVPTFGYGIDPQDKGPGKAMSYAVKYALLKALGLETGDDPDMDDVDHERDDPTTREPPKLDSAPQFSSAAERDRITAAIAKAHTLPDLANLWKSEAGTLKEMNEPHRLELTKIKDAKKAALSPPDPAMQAPQNAHEYQ